MDQLSLQRYLKIAIPVPLRKIFHYLPPKNFPMDTLPGSRIRVPFGNQTLNGVLLGYSSKNIEDKYKLKKAEKLLDHSPILTKSVYELCVWASEYYHHPVGEVFAAAIPSLLRKGHSSNIEVEQFFLTDEGRNLDRGALRNAPRQHELISLFRRTKTGISRKNLNQISTRVIQSLVDKDLIVRKFMKSQPFHFDRLNDNDIIPTTEQQAAIKSVGESGVYLLQGVTGSGKTEVYLQLIEEKLKAGQQSLVLVPEIGLTPQTVQRFQARFRVKITVLHSALSATERLLGWQDMASGHAGIIIGTRSSIFTPMAKPGLIIVDEEHDSSFKQHQGFRYSARDLAVMRGKIENISVLLGSATPSLESLHNVRLGKYAHLHLRERPAGISKESYSIINLKHKGVVNGLSDQLVEMIDYHLSKKGQILIFLNRRGFSPVLLCSECKWMAACPRCDARLTYHLSRDKMECHHCNFKTPRPKACPECQGSELLKIGLGTEKIEEHLNTLFPNTRVIRIDRDSTRNKNSFGQLLKEIEDGEPAILIGTQMLAKGHNFSNVTLSVLIEIDSSFYSADYRAEEQLGQIILQVGGRSGRGKNKGTVVIQTHFPSQPALKQLIADGYEAFAEKLLKDRRENELPPYSYQAILRAESNSSSVALNFLRKVANIRKPNPSVSLFGPFPSNMEKRAGRFRAVLLLSSSSRGKLHRDLSYRISYAERLHLRRKVRWSVDVDPIDLF
ncbi:MAG: primosomal protein N' [Gammaproteobacteria bacterium]|nr:primosomal protein N' [Gammaproteobacteria bacterium]OUV67723.1 MAG: primosomal protein N' [Gammaproteobacteria bacterium TMED133]